MPVIVDATAPSQDLYDAVSQKIVGGDQLPEGCRAHIAGPADGRFRVLTVWDDEESFRKFREEKLLPAIREVAGDDAPMPEDPAVYPVHRLVL